MRAGLCMIVRDEAQNIEACLGDIVDLFDDVIVVDTGSRDRTREILERNFGIHPIDFTLDQQFWFNKHEARNLAFRATRSPWILSLDADERLDRKALSALIGRPEEPGVDGYFLRWTTYKHGLTIEDYKLALFRKGYESLGLVHENVQQSMRAGGGATRWCDSPDILHFPDPEKFAFKKHFYKQRLSRAIARDPSWYRYHWFLGYAHFREGNLDEARPLLMAAAQSRSPRFPVECLNACVVLAQLCATSGDAVQTSRILQSAIEFYEEVEDDFEVRVNFRLRPWLERASAACAVGRLGEIVAYEFSA